jgi:hypothetical protein
VAACGVHEQRQRVGRPGRVVVVEDASAGGRAGGRLGLLALLDLDRPCVELQAKLGQLLGVEVVLEREGVELVLGGRPPLLGLLEEGSERRFNDVGQFVCSFCVGFRRSGPRIPLARCLGGLPRTTYNV